MDGKTELFWIHIKKSAGISTRKVLAPLYQEVDRTDRPKTFIQATPDEYNDILNNFRIPLGEYQFRRCLFAREFLYKAKWNSLLKFGFCREPVDRCVSQFFYLFYPKDDRSRLRMKLSSWIKPAEMSGAHKTFDLFLDRIAEVRASSSNFAPYGLHFQTHTAAMWDDVVNEVGTVLLDHVFRLEDFAPAIQFIREAAGVAPLPEDSLVHLNKSDRTLFTPSAAQRRRIEDLFAGDFELYERAANRSFA